jgi:hypothetical protein
MGGFWGLAIATAIGAVAWIYQRAWDRQQYRIERYQAFLDRLPGFTQGGVDPDQIDEALKEIRRLYLFAPNDVARAANAFIEAVEKGESKRRTLGKLIIAMRRDASFQAALFPRFYRNDLKENEVCEIKTAKRKRGETEGGAAA